MLSIAASAQLLVSVWRRVANAPLSKTAPLAVSGASLFVSWWNNREQRKWQQENPILTAQFERTLNQETGLDRLRLRVSLVNSGPVPFTLRRLGIKDIRTGAIISPKWNTHKPVLPELIKQGEQAIVDYYADDAVTHPEITDASSAVAELASGRTLKLRIKQRRMWRESIDILTATPI